MNVTNYTKQLRGELMDKAFIYVDMANSHILTEKTLREYFQDVEITYKVDFGVNNQKIRTLVDTTQAFTYLLFEKNSYEVMKTMLNKVLTLAWEIETADVGSTRELFALLDSFLGVKQKLTISMGGYECTVSY